MRIVSIESVKSKKNKITLDDRRTLYLYDSEIKKLNLVEDMNIDNDLYSVIFEDYLVARAKKKALAILEKAMNTKCQLRDKLKRNDYNEDVINIVMGFLEEYNLINDYDYAKAYINSYSNKKSVRVLEFDLEVKGVDRNIIKELIGELDTEDIEIRNIEKFVSRYRDAEGNILQEKRNKLKSSLYRKGYKVDNIKRVIDDIY